MAFHPIRIALYFALAIFSIIMIGMTSARINYTKSRDSPDPIKSGAFSYYDPIIVQLLVTYIFALLWSFWAMFSIGSRADRGFGTSYAFEYFWLFVIWVMGLVGAAVATHYWHGNIAFCRPFNNQCRLLTAIVSCSWIAWSTLTLLTLTSCFSQRSADYGFKAPLHGREDAAYPGPEVRTAPGGGPASQAA